MTNNQWISPLLYRQCKIIERQVCDSVPSQECQLVPKERRRFICYIKKIPAILNIRHKTYSSHSNNATLSNVSNVSMYRGNIDKVHRKRIINNHLLVFNIQESL